MPTPAGENSHVNLAAVGFADPNAAFDSIQMAATPGWWPIGNYTGLWEVKGGFWV
jgi:hypothetical protein